jgi:SAM-dependent methyltransferase
MPMPDLLKVSLRQAYNKMAQNRDALEVEDWKREVRGHFLALLQQEQKVSLLELGAGPGGDSLFFAKQGLDVCCTDFSPEMVAICRQKGLRAQVVDFMQLPFARATFDAVYALNSLLHLPKKAMPAALRGISVVMKPGGLFFLGLYGGYESEGVWQDDFYEPKRFFSFYSDAHLLDVVSAVFQIQQFERIISDESNPDLYFQALILRKKGK